MTELGVEIDPKKSIEGKTLFEFAKLLFTPKGQIAIPNLIQ